MSTGKVNFVFPRESDMGKVHDRPSLYKIVNPHQNDQGRKGPCFFQRLIALKCLKCQQIKKNI
jgi:hypothetical protein